MRAGRFTWDERKRAANLAKHAVDFAIVERFAFDTAVVIIDKRKDYGEVRYRALGMIDGRLHALVFTARAERIRVISLRRANERERRNYAETQKG